MGEIGSFCFREASVVLASAVFFLVHQWFW